MLDASAEHLESLWLNAKDVSDPTEKESLLRQFRDALHQYVAESRRNARKSFLVPALMCPSV